jgi:hypothetical protein
VKHQHEFATVTRRQWHFHAVNPCNTARRIYTHGQEARSAAPQDLWISGSYGFGGHNDVGALRAGVGFTFGARYKEVLPPPPATWH